VSITLVSPGKTFKLRAQTRAEHKLWTTGFRAICTHAEFVSFGEPESPPRLIRNPTGVSPRLTPALRLYITITKR
jgi:hypothetical protein